MSLPPQLPLAHQPGYLQQQRQADDSHLVLLAVFYFILAALTLIILVPACFGFLFFGAVGASEGLHPLTGGSPILPNDAGSENVHQFVGLFSSFFAIVFAGVAAVALLNGVANLLTGIFLLKRRHRTFCYVVAAFNCLHVPYGIALGIFTFIVLGRPSVVEAFETSDPTATG